MFHDKVHETAAACTALLSSFVSISAVSYLKSYIPCARTQQQQQPNRDRQQQNKATQCTYLLRENAENLELSAAAERESEPILDTQSTTLIHHLHQVQHDQAPTSSSPFPFFPTTTTSLAPLSNSKFPPLPTTQFPKSHGGTQNLETTKSDSSSGIQNL